VCAGFLAATAFTSTAQTTAKPASAASSNAQISSDWDTVIKDAVPQRSSSSTSAATIDQKSSYTPPAPENFLNHFYFDTHTEYSHYNYYFSGQPTATGVIDAPSTGSVNPNGFPYPPSFDPSGNEMYSYIDLGTRGLGSDRINTNFAIRYNSQLSSLTNASPSLNVLTTFPGAHLFDIMSGNVEINGRPTDGWFANSTVRIGRQTVSGPFLAEFDGAAYTRNAKRYSVTLFGGRRFTYYSDPVQRGIGGVGINVRLTDKITVGYQGLYYLNGNNAFTYNQRINDTWLVNGYFRMVGRHPVDFNAVTFWAPNDGKTTVSVGFFQKLSSYDYAYDYALAATDNSAYNTLPRLYLDLLAPYSQLTLDVRRTINSQFRIGGGVVIHHLDSTGDQSAFNTSFRDFHVNADIFPVRGILTTFAYDFRNVDRINPADVTTFGVDTANGETQVQDLSAEIGHTFGENRFNVEGGGFFRRINYQTSYVLINNAQDKGWLASASYRVDPRTRLYFDYTLDTDFFVWRPSIKNGQVFRVGVDWKY
jgi:hypothetical protein